MTYEWEIDYKKETQRADHFKPDTLVLPINSAILSTRMLLSTAFHQGEQARLDMMEQAMAEIENLRQEIDNKKTAKLGTITSSNRRKMNHNQTLDRILTLLKEINRK